MTESPTQRIRDVELGRDVRIMDFVNLYGCSIGDQTLIGTFVEVQEGVRIGARCKIESHSFVCAGTTIADEVFVGHHVSFTNDRRPAATTEAGEPKGPGDWVLEPAVVESRASIGSGAVILPGVTIGAGAMVGAGSVVTRDVGPGTTVAGNPARPLPPREDSDRITLFDPLAEYAEIGRAVEEAIARVVRSGRFIGGPEVAGFEAEFGEAVAGRAVAAVGSGTDALRLALVGLGVGPGDEVILPANTFTATAMAVEGVGAIPVVADVDPELHVLTAAQVEPVLTAATRAIVPVHLYGHPAPMPELLELAAGGIAVLEDAAQAHGALGHGRPAGAWGTAAAFSFYPSKNLGAYGDAGAVVGDHDLIARMRVLRDLGRDDRGAHVEIALNSRLDAMQAAVLRAKLPHLAEWVDRRRALADGYRERLADVPAILPVEAPWARHAYHLFVIRVADRDAVREALSAEGIETGIHYPTPIHLQPAHAGRVKVPRPVDVTERLAGEILSLPLHPQMTSDDQDRVAGALARALRRAP
jgi:dTDP-4-amino-4,6-dideoxygalactose transaminase/acetyltransferase-like isoleucine patch superfamily enzyme